MDPNNVQPFGQFNHAADLTRVVNNTAPLATTWHGVSEGPSVNYAAPKASGQGVLPAFWGKVENLATETGSLVAGASKWIAHAGVDAIKSPYQFGEGLSKTILNHQKGNDLQTQSKDLATRLDGLMSAYKSGRISKDDYLKGMKLFNDESARLQKDLMDFQSQTSIDEKNAVKAAVNTASDVLTVATLGGSAAAMSATQQAAIAGLTRAEALTTGAAAITKLASEEAAWKAVTPFGQQAIKLATSQVLEAAGKQVTAQQLSKAVAANVLLKFPLTYNFVSETGVQIYDELDNAKYGDAVKTAAFNAALMFAGGPIGWGVKRAGKVLKSASTATGLRPGSILDELSSRAGDGNRRALAEYAAKLIKDGKEDDVKAMIVGLESNLARTNGNQAKAVNFIQDHLENYVGWGSMNNMTHEEVWDNMVNYWKHAEGLNALKTSGQIEGVAANDARVVVPGRFTVQDKNQIAAAEDWEAWKVANPNSAAANNPNLDKQIGKIFENIKDPEARGRAIRDIPAQFGLEGVPKDYAKQMAKDGYVAIVPKSHNVPVVPFEKTGGKLVTNGAEGDYFVKAAQPVPVLRSVGTFLTWAGMSPEVASVRVMDVFKGNLSTQLEEVGHKGLQGDSIEQTADDLIKRLSNYMKAPTGGPKVFGNVLPITDLRQLTTGDVMRALDVSKAEAKNIQTAIMQAHLDVPRSIVGLGTKIMDYNFKYNPAATMYTRVQGALRFSWNPIFTQGKLPIKAEILAQLQTGGKFPTVAGTNTFMKLFFPGKYKEIDGIIKDKQFLDLIPGGSAGEAADAFGYTFKGTDHYKKNALRPVAGVVQSMAEKMGMDAKTLIDQHPEMVGDAATAILHYDRKASFLNSPMLRTLNVAFFPLRFETKVTTFMVKALVKQDPIVQYAIIKGTMDAHKFLNSPQGQAWYSEHSEAISLFKYFSPLATLSVISNAIGLKHDSTAQYGELGGLPFGWIPMMLDSVGLTHFGEAYVNPKTGVIAKDYVPTSMYGAANAAIQDLLSSLYSYPGAELGWPSKGKIDRTIVGGVLPGSSNDFKTVDPSNITPEDKQFAQNVQSANGTAPQTNVPSASFLPGTNVPAQGSTVEQRNPNKKIKAPGSGSSSSTAKKKKAEYTPELLPGQSTLGQL